MIFTTKIFHPFYTPFLMQSITLTRPSSAVSELVVCPDLCAVTATFKTGHKETFSGLNSGDIENLLTDTTVSVGKWVNQICLGNTVANELQFN